MSQSNQSEPTSKIPWHKTPAGIAHRQTPEYKAKQKVHHKAYRQTPGGKAKRKAYQQTPENKAKLKAYQQTPEYKACKKAYDQTLEYKAYQKAYQQTPEYKAKKKAHRQTPQWKLRQAICRAFARIGKNKPADTRTLLGCDWKEAKAHFESLFKEGMNWDNHGVHGWHIDHIRPVSSFKEDELHLMNRISNLQPLWADENWEKGDKIL